MGSARRWRTLSLSVFGADLLLRRHCQSCAQGRGMDTGTSVYDRPECVLNTTPKMSACGGLGHHTFDRAGKEYFVTSTACIYRIRTTYTTYHSNPYYGAFFAF
jgi:hypothetical protein